MNWGRFKTLLLTVLVALSLVLTWNLWTYQSEFHKPENTKYVESAIVQDGKRTLSQVVHPAKAIYQKANGHYVGVRSGTDLNGMFEMVTKAEFHSAQTFGNNPPDQKAGRFDKHGIEMIFPVSIPISLFEKMLQGDASQQPEKTMLFSEDDSTIRFDRIIFYHLGEAHSTDMKAYFKNGDKLVASVKVNGLSFTDLKNFYKGAQEYTPQKLDGKTTYLPKHEVKVKKISYFYQWLGDAPFKNVLFNNNPYVTQRQGFYTSYSQLLKINDHVINYINTEPGSEKSNQTDTMGDDGSSVISDSFSYINGQSGWTDSYMLFNYSPARNLNSQQSVIFRMLIGYNNRRTFPVFSDVSGYPYNDAGTIRLTWQNGGVYEYGRTQMDVGDTPDGKTSITLSSGADVLYKLKKSQNVHMKLVKDLRIGYQMEYPPKKEAVVFTPKWFVYYDGSWEPVEKLVDSKKQAKEGTSQ